MTAQAIPHASSPLLKQYNGQQRSNWHVPRAVTFTTEADDAKNTTNNDANSIQKQEKKKI